MKKYIKSIIDLVLFFIGFFFFMVVISFYTLLYTGKVEFVGEYALYTKMAAIFGTGLLFGVSILFMMGFIKVRFKMFKWFEEIPYRRLVTLVFSVFALYGIMFVIIVWTGVRFDATDWGITAALFGKTFVLIMPGVLCIIALITILIATSGNFWLMIFKLLFVVAFFAGIYLGIVPRIIVYF